MEQYVFSRRKALHLLGLGTITLLAQLSCEKDESKHDYVPSPEIIDLLTKTSWKLVRWQERAVAGQPLKDIILTQCLKDDVYTFKKGGKNGGAFELSNKGPTCSSSAKNYWEYTRENELTFNNFGRIVLTLNQTHFILTFDDVQHDVQTYVRTPHPVF